MTYEQNKKAILKWRELHTDNYRDYQRKYAKEHYDEQIKTKKQQYYLIKKEFKAFLNILL